MSLPIIPLKKRKQPETSTDAYKSLDPRELNETYRSILFALDEIGEGTFEDIACWLKLPSQVVWKRLSELSNMNLIYRPGNKRTLKSGRKGFTWMKVSPAKTKEEKQEIQSFFDNYQMEKQNLFIQKELF